MPATAQHVHTLHALLAAPPNDAAALGAPGRPALSFGALRALMASTQAWLAAHGVARHERVAIVLPNGPEMAACFVACANACAAAPLNPAYRAEEFEFFLNDLQPKAVIVEQQSDSPCVAVAQRLGIAVFELLIESSAEAGLFTLRAAAPAGPAVKPEPVQAAQAAHVAMLLHTSGTTSRPKLVPLTQGNLCASAKHIAATLQFTPSDRGLNIMPLFHIHGLMAGVLAPLSAGAYVCCTPGFNALRFFAWMDEAAPTWYSAVPTMHQAIVARAAKNQEVIARHKLRFIRSSSSSMPPQVIAEVEAAFAAPLIESYGMTEAAHQMASNPLPPLQRKPGTVGLAAGPEVAVLDAAGQVLPRGASGEVVIRGANVMAGYIANPQANLEAFHAGWFRTGDLGAIDDEGYLSITGRLKEIINRGGEKVSPREVDEVLMDHPAVAQVVTFAMPHAKLGEDVAACVVLREGHQASERELQAFVATRLADFKVPRHIVLRDDIPKGATGKLQRIGLAAKLGLVAP